jgi:hypothetical protein
MKRQTLGQTALITPVVVQNLVTAASVIMFQYFGKLGKYLVISKNWKSEFENNKHLAGKVLMKLFPTRVTVNSDGTPVLMPLH